MNHRPITEDDLHAYVDRVLEPERQAEVAAYLGDHPEVAKRVAAFSDQRDSLRAALAPIAEEPCRRSSICRASSRTARRRPSVARWAMAAMLLLSIGGLGGWAVRGAIAGVAGRIGCARSGGGCFV
jgi:Predicted transmembrane transcriptional regulator (anti-sigma factor)